MSNFFVNLYNYFARHKIILYLSLVASIAIMGYFALQLKFEENITQFFPDTKNEQNLNTVFDNLRIKDKIIVMFSFSSSDKEQDNDTAVLTESATLFADSLLARTQGTYVNNILLRIDDSLKTEMQNFVYDNLPILLSDSDYQRIDSLFSKEKVASVMHRNYSNLLSPAGGFLKEYIMRDPLSLGGNALKRLQDFQLDSNFEQQDGYIFSKDGSMLLLFITPTYSMGSTGQNDKLISAIEKEIAAINKDYPSVKAEYYGGPSVGVYNARQIKEDSILTITLALVIIIVFILLAFRQKRTIFQIITPTIFGGLFALFMISLLKGSISSIAVGSGSIIMGVALSYSIHMVVHQSHVASVTQLIKELTYPLTVGSFTTIGAFLGLLFTSSELLRDFGLFASMTLIGTIIFCLIYLPHFLDGRVHQKRSALLRFIERFNAYRFDKNKWLVGGILILTVICIFTSRNVGFDTDMMHMNYEPEHLKEAEQKLAEIVDNDKKNILFVSVGKNTDEAIQNYNATNKKLSVLKGQGLINNFASADYFLIPEDIRQERLQKWNNYWTAGKKEFLKTTLKSESATFNFRQDAFAPFYKWIDSDFTLHKDITETNRILNDWQTNVPGLTLLISQVQLDDKNKEEVYQHFNNGNEVVILDRSFFTKKWVSAINDDFYLILFISSFLIFITLLISYGRIELTLISFSPMFISWIIIIGIMGISGMEFNIINIILSTFIFGIGDDFSIFIMDGLQNKYRTNKPALNGHKTAIFFSAFTIIVGMGALIFAQHPALQSISLMSILGMIVVVLVSYTIPPVIFRIFMSSQTTKGLPPYTLASILITAFIYGLFLAGCLFLRITILLLYLVPVKRSKKRQFICYLIMLNCRFICFAGFILKKKKVNTGGETFKKPAIIIANHQSFLDILLLLTLHPKMVMVTNEWVWRSPFFGAVIRYAGYFYTGEGYENSVSHIKERIDEGYSVVIFPEGTRSYDGRLKRFHKGAFYLSEALKLDIIPIILYGTGMVISKSQPFYLKRGIIATKILPRITYEDRSFGNTYKERTKNTAAYFASEYAKVCTEYNTAINPYFYHMLVKNYIYKGPVMEWYVRIKVKMEKSYKIFDELIPERGQITDIGCGYGTLGYMLAMLSPDRQVLGIDYDEDKAGVARYGYLHKENTAFVHADALEYPLPESDVFILNDMLHYMDNQKQESLLKRCVQNLNDNGLIIVRDGDSRDKQKQKLTKLSEIFSTRIFGFNKTKEELCFTSAEKLYEIAESCNMAIESFKNDKYTSNTIFIFKKKEEKTNG
ncbi:MULTISPECIES: trifunctional MMPL family transporter/lysophospholipid acyltransferase/class I SAM-dependent methyltransferase [unclassified Dysgonomonas]|uniref:trifunctional MMPL family transporter/lysophospholipid acyltransferase/class I SAM-dependent methyltransferase n=1 Tax=unclassified Dysgonomonas TaxID=2630389 RepID=UPI0025C3FF92|nr:MULTISPECIES: trifunctional MMPL family transporter/lysophospholipid acyltransferase/class I SAM-dependent methyltransferase [unclassified Dysgonomonas]MDR2004638.1 1-acyl-sn-glycerol-3-phosphate acyltransferase [Prevotella sp.]HMM02149.1 1-acyl-sn-glycerol-3-phosphate acyltransferase [Dysgonomonas sp.]